MKTHPGLRVSEIEDVSILLSSNTSLSGDLSMPINDSIVQNVSFYSNLQQQHQYQQQQVKQKIFNEQQRPSFYKYRTEAIGIDKLNSKPHPSFLVCFFFFKFII